MSARYDAIADWYRSWVGDQGDGLIAEDASGLLPSTLQGVYVLDVACGHGRAARALARRGARVVGVDVSTELVDLARRADTEVALGVCYHVAEVSNVSTWCIQSADCCVPAARGCSGPRFGELIARYEADDSLRMSGTVFNVLRDQLESV